MNRLFLLILLVFFVLNFSIVYPMGFLEKIFNDDSNPNPELEEVLLKEYQYLYERSDNLAPGKAAVSFSSEFTGTINIVKLDDTILHFGKLQSNNWETWIGNDFASYTYPLTLKLITKKGDKYTAIIKEAPDQPEPPPIVDPPVDPPPVYGGSKNYHHWNPLSWEDKGSTLMLCYNSPKFDSCKLNTGNRIINMQKWANTDPDIYNRPRTLWTITNIPHLSGQVICKKGSKEYKYSVPESRKMYPGDCWKKR